MIENVMCALLSPFYFVDMMISSCVHLPAKDIISFFSNSVDIPHFQK